MGYLNHHAIQWPNIFRYAVCMTLVIYGSVQILKPHWCAEDFFRRQGIASSCIDLIQPEYLGFENEDVV